MRVPLAPRRPISSPQGESALLNGTIIPSTSVWIVTRVVCEKKWGAQRSNFSQTKDTWRFTAPSPPYRESLSPDKGCREYLPASVKGSPGRGQGFEIAEDSVNKNGDGCSSFGLSRPVSCIENSPLPVKEKPWQDWPKEPGLTEFNLPVEKRNSLRWPSATRTRRKRDGASPSS